MKDKGIPLSALFRMADCGYAQEVTNETLINAITQLKLGLTDQEALHMVFSMDTSLNGRIDEKEFREFVCTFGVGDDPEETFKLEGIAMDKFLRFLRERKSTPSKLFDEIDTDHGGTIDANEIRLYLKDNKGKLNENEIFMVLSHLDPDKKGFISRKIFEAALTTQSKKDDANKVND